MKCVEHKRVKRKLWHARIVAFLQQPEEDVPRVTWPHDTPQRTGEARPPARTDLPRRGWWHARAKAVTLDACCGPGEPARCFPGVRVFPAVSLTRAGRAWRWGRGALGILLTYALFIQLVFAGMVAERMAFAASAADPICASAADGAAGPAPDGTDGGRPAHGQACVVCAFAGLAPPLPERIVAMVPATAPGACELPVRSQTTVEARPAPSPRTSQGPPALG